LLGTIAFAQLGAASWVFFHRLKDLRGTPGKLVAGNSSTRSVANTTRAGQPSGTEPVVAPEDPFEASGNPLTTAPIAPPQKPEPVPLPKIEAPPPPPENRFQEMMQQGRALRNRGDTNTALIRFREASLLEPSNAETISEIAQTYEKMGLGDKAAEQWKRIYDLGPDAGTLFIAAESRLKMTQVQTVASLERRELAPAEPTEVSSTRPGAMLGVGEIVREERADSSAQLKFALQIPLKAKLGVAVNVRDVDIHVLFYDQLDPKTVVQTGADVSYKFTSAPVDWANGEPETLEVQYHQPLPLGKGPKHEERKYYGYVVRVYYKDELQDARAEPLTLNAKFPAPQVLDRAGNPK